MATQQDVIESIQQVWRATPGLSIPISGGLWDTEAPAEQALPFAVVRLEKPVVRTQSLARIIRQQASFVVLDNEHGNAAMLAEEVLSTYLGTTLDLTGFRGFWLTEPVVAETAILADRPIIQAAFSLRLEYSQQ